jgi:hypothetical protein
LRAEVDEIEGIEVEDQNEKGKDILIQTKPPIEKCAGGGLSS